jgi:hypothetical protein
MVDGQPFRCVKRLIFSRANKELWFIALRAEPCFQIEGRIIVLSHSC